MRPTDVHSVKRTSATSSRLDEVDLALGGAALERVDERARVARERRERGLDAVERGLGEAGADPPGVPERAGVVVVAEEQRAEGRRARALARRPAADDELLVREVLHLQPGGGAAPRFVDAVDAAWPRRLRARTPC